MCSSSCVGCTSPTPWESCWITTWRAFEFKLLFGVFESEKQSGLYRRWVFKGAVPIPRQQRVSNACDDSHLQTPSPSLVLTKSMPSAHAKHRPDAASHCSGCMESRNPWVHCKGFAFSMGLFSGGISNWPLVNLISWTRTYIRILKTYDILYRFLNWTSHWMRNGRNIYWNFTPLFMNIHCSQCRGSYSTDAIWSTEPLGPPSKQLGRSFCTPEGKSWLSGRRLEFQFVSSKLESRVLYHNDS